MFYCQFTAIFQFSSSGGLLTPSIVFKLTAATKGISYFIPGTKYANNLNPKWPNNDPNSFWCEDAVTISRIHQAKGNEADIVLEKVGSWQDGVFTLEPDALRSWEARFAELGQGAA